MKNRLMARALFAALMMVGAASPAMANNGGCTEANGSILCATVPEPGDLELLGMGVAGAIAVRLITRRRK